MNTFSVRITREQVFELEIEARDQHEAKEAAQVLLSAGEISALSNIIDTVEIDAIAMVECAACGEPHFGPRCDVRKPPASERLMAPSWERKSL